ncbi:MAG TPA: FliM/FliN family flagellar motor C-terminal domain-containing protein [Roseateles sp.]
MPRPPHGTAEPTPPPCQPWLDPRALGRPVHLLPRFAETLRERLDETLRLQLNRRWRSQYAVGELVFQPLDGVAGAGRWLAGKGSHGLLACRMERPLLLSVMSRRYGDNASGSQPETSSEERVQQQLTRLLLDTTLASLLETDTPTPELRPTMAPGLPDGSWLLKLTLREAEQGLASRVVIALAPDYLAPLLVRLAPSRTRPPLVAAQDLPRLLNLKLQARLLQHELSLGELLALRPGSLLPIRLRDSDVLVDGKRLFTATVAEHQGKLCLTSFQDAE